MKVDEEFGFRYGVIVFVCFCFLVVLIGLMFFGFVWSFVCCFVWCSSFGVVFGFWVLCWLFFMCWFGVCMVWGYGMVFWFKYWLFFDDVIKCFVKRFFWFGCIV